MESFSARLKRLREAASLSVVKLADLGGVTENAIRQMELGYTKSPSFATGVRLAEALGVSAAHLAMLGDDGPLSPPAINSNTIELRAIQSRLASIEGRLGAANDEFTLEPLRANEVDLGLVDSSQPMRDPNLAAMPMPLRLARLETVIREMADQLRDQVLVNELLLGQAGVKMPLADNTVSIMPGKKSRSR